MIIQQGPGQQQQMRPQGQRGQGQHPNQMMDPNQQHMDEHYMMDGQSQQQPQQQVGIKTLLRITPQKSTMSTFVFYLKFLSRFNYE